MTAAPGAPVAIIADDLTGANDTAVQFTRQGWDARLVLAELNAVELSSEATTVFAATTDARPMPYDDARRVTSDAAARAVEAGAERFYLKVDSTVRGSIAAQVDGALEALGGEVLAVICPAYPHMGRTLHEAVLLVGGIPVAETSLRDDPTTPVSSSDMRQLVPGATALPRANSADGYAAAMAAAYARGDRLVIADASTEADLDSLARAVATASHRVLPVGSAGLAAALAGAWERHQVPMEPSSQQRVSDVDNILVQVSSLNPVSLAQLEALRSAPGTRVTVLEPKPADFATEQAMHEWMEDHLRQVPDGVTVITAPRDRAGDARMIAEGLGEISATLLRSGAFAAAGFVGGDGAFAALRAAGCTALRVLEAIEEGIPLAIATDGELAGMLIFTKAGGFGADTSLTQAVESMRRILKRNIA
ncbi:four-carbon acid sugar kinase family protein [Nesterenkonia muleiensis]|uniref:four-carbon acid sugar kinase family protein n=1 Tax=Nesterenkonia muleiensis TaxID=2282648 RepID=UPI000E73E5E4|nr:four-carbon acid sugar kinase family protein [Nesterenkonia muleiensis]